MNKGLIWILAGFLSLTTRAHAEPPDGYRFFAFDEGIWWPPGRNETVIIPASWWRISERKGL